jgi:hypothetical protein
MACSSGFFVAKKTTDIDGRRYTSLPIRCRLSRPQRLSIYPPLNNFPPPVSIRRRSTCYSIEWNSMPTPAHYPQLCVTPTGRSRTAPLPARREFCVTPIRPIIPSVMEAAAYQGPQINPHPGILRHTARVTTSAAKSHFASPNRTQPSQLPSNQQLTQPLKYTPSPEFCVTPLLSR